LGGVDVFPALTLNLFKRVLGSAFTLAALGLTLTCETMA
jgi:hypothetical protein